MKWHDCKTDPPKSTGIYLLVYRITHITVFVGILLFILLKLVIGKMLEIMVFSIEECISQSNGPKLI